MNKCLYSAVIALAIFSAFSTPSRADFLTGLTLAQQGDFVGALREWKPMAEQGDAEAQYYVGSLFNKGYGVPQNSKKAFKWFEKAAALGHLNAQFNLGNMYFDGRGTAMDYEKSVEWHRKAADRGHAEAQFNLGTAYALDRGVPTDYSIAYMWMRISEANGRKDVEKGIAIFKGQMTQSEISLADDLALKWKASADD